jgi:hypothetical protein
VVGWFWMNVPLMLVFFGLWVGIPLWLVLTRWDKEVKARHAEVAAWHAHIAARAAAEEVAALSAQVAEADEIASPAYAGVAGEH